MAYVTLEEHRDHTYKLLLGMKLRRRTMFTTLCVYKCTVYVLYVYTLCVCLSLLTATAQVLNSGKRKFTN